jgi:DNA-binding CsgD family transcriptional regulator
MSELVRSLHPGLLDGEVARLVDAAGGSPMLAELHAADQPAGSGGLSASVDALVARLSDRARRGLALLALAPGPLPPDVIGGEVIGGEVIGGEEEELLAAGVARHDGDGRVELAHRLFGDSVLALLDEDERRSAWSRLSDIDGLSPTQQAQCRWGAGDLAGAYELAVSAAAGPVTRVEQAAALGVAADAARTDPVAVGLGPEECDELLIRAAAALNDTGAFDRAADLVADPSRCAPALRVPAAVEAFRSALGRCDRVAAAALVESNRWILECPASHGVVRARSMFSVLASWSDGRAAGGGPSLEVADLVEEYRAAVGGAQRSSAALLAGLASYWHDVEQAADWFSVAREEGERAHATAAEFEAARNLILVQTAVGRHVEARDLALECAERAAAMQDEVWWVEFRTLEVLSRQQDAFGHDDAMSWLSFVRTSPARLETRAAATVGLSTLLADRGDATRSSQVLSEWTREGALESFEPMIQAVISWAVVQRAWLIGDLDEVIRWARWVTDTVPRGYPSLAGTQVVWRWAEYESGIPITAPDPAGGLLDAAELEAGAIDLLVAGSPELAAVKFLDAAESWRPILWRCSLRCRWAAGHAWYLAGDAARAEELLVALDAVLDPSGCSALRPRLQATLRQVTGRAGSGRRGQRGGVVTDKELMVLRLVADGLTSPEIARRLSISVSTVNSHVRSAKRKLGVSTRVEAASAVTAADLAGS